MASQKPGVSPALLVLMLALGGAALLVASQFVAPSYSAHVEALGGLLLGWAMRRPGDLNSSTHPDDLALLHPDDK